MSIRAIFAECSEPFWVDVAKHLEKEDGWEICYWIGGARVADVIKKAFPDAVFHNNMNAIRGIRPSNCPQFTLPALDQTLLQDLSIHESTVFNMLERMDPGNAFTYQERLRLYYFQIKYWLAVLDYYKPDVVVFPTTPHEVFDYILYMLCKRKRIKTVMFLMFSGFFFPIENVEDEFDATINFYNKLLSNGKTLQYTLSPSMENYWNKVSSDRSTASPTYMKGLIEKKRNYNFVVFITNKIKALYKYIGFIYKPAPPNYLKQKNKRFEDSQMTYLKFVKLCKFDSNRKKKKLKDHYNKLTQKVSLDKPYIYVALAYQPENSTSPRGGVFVNQFLMVDLLSKSIPEGWCLYVKEHLNQFAQYTAGDRFRSFDFYNDIASLPNVKLIPLSVSTFDLIDNSMAIATVTGTAGWEAVVRGKPALIFGYAWYRACEGVFYTPTVESCKEAISKIQKGYKVDSDKVKAFLYALEKTCYRGYVVIDYYDKMANISQKENAISIIQAIQDFYKNNKKTMSVV
ncbi:MAG: hypothetical protein PHS93_04575 [Candidatus Omnitrophica bacterium]|nr:hypothetical protein [Candidatus Omnitrophota bacterium]MDD5352426.1 hypothetical protein [Candidatus Omnitrophota bacterium]MDD5550024.1 hypothetical protein [Candidatus Omnitrophota bacterium]